jgi:alanyl-tRNA synthetase
MTSSDIRRQFLEFFRSKEHAIVDSSPVVPHDDPTLMFTNAGMNQFKDVFLGAGSRPYRRAADTQKCIRAGGKHNDLDDVGQDTYHHTFFEMLGNWSFGDYFKKEAIAWAWELLTKVWGIDKTRLHATYFEGDASEGLEPDSEAKQLWRTVTDINPDHIHPGNKKDNFWEMGDSGPCGPCSEIHIDLTPDKSGSHLVNKGDASVMEVWNLVFIQYNRGTDGRLVPLPAKHVDTGMGFERICAVLQCKTSNYDTDVFTPIFEAIRKRTGAAAYAGMLPGKSQNANTSKRQHEGTGAADQLMVDVSYRVIADHLRCLTFALTDGAVPSNEGRGYVLRRILRRAVRYGRQYLGMHEPFLCDLVEPLVVHMGGVFPELIKSHGGRNVAHVTEILREEEESFGRTLDRGIKLFNEAAEYAMNHHHGRMGGEDAFKLHDTYGFPIDLTELMAIERGLTVDIGEYERLMEVARDKARATSKVVHPELAAAVTQFGATQFLGYDKPALDEVKVLGVLCGKQLDAGVLHEEQEGALILAATPFYAEQGGQVGDRGMIADVKGRWEFRVTDTHKVDRTVVHFGVCDRGTITADSTLTASAKLDLDHRHPTMQNHTATHLLNHALREVLGDHVNQKGSLVDPDRTRFDFSHTKALEDAELVRIEGLVNAQIRTNHPVFTKEVDQNKARQINTLRAVFGEKYPEKVRVVAIGMPIDALIDNPHNPDWMHYSVEFCGGTHVSHTGEIRHFVLTGEEAVAKGIRRVVGVSGDRAAAVEAAGDRFLEEAKSLGADTQDFPKKLADFQSRAAEADIPIRTRHELRHRIAELQKTAKAQDKASAAAGAEAVMAQAAALLESARAVGGVTVVVGEVSSASTDALRSAVDWIRQKTPSSAVLLASVDEGKVTLLCGMSKAAVDRGLKAGDLIKEVSPLVGGKGGGRPDMAQGGGPEAAGLGKALEAAGQWIAGRLG